MPFPTSVTYNAFCGYGPWSGHWPLASHASPPHELLQDSYCFLTQLWRAIRERRAICDDRTDWPFGSVPWTTAAMSGVITAVTDNLDGTISFEDSAADDDGVGWIDGSAVKRWTGFGGHFNGEDISGFAPGTYKLVLYPPDTGNPSATRMGDPNFGLVFLITDNTDTAVIITDDGRLTLNGLTLSQYVGFRYQIIGHGSHDENDGWGWVMRYPPRPNDPELDYGTITASTTSSITDDRDASSEGWQTPKRFTNALIGKDIFLKSGNLWKRCRIRSGRDDTIQFTPPVSPAPTGEYWITEHNAYFRPEFRLRMSRQTGRGGKFWTLAGSSTPWQDGGSNPWSIMSTWYAGWTDTAYSSHLPSDDTVGTIKKFTETVTRSQGLGIDPCADSAVTVFDVDARIDFADHCGYGDALFNPWLYGYSLRGLQLAVEDTFANAAWLEPKNYESARAIPAWVDATWRKYWNAANTRTTTITAVPGAPAGTATINTITLPRATPQQGNYTSLDCTFAVLDANGDVKRSGSGTVAASSLAWNDGDFEDSGANDDTGLTVVIAFGWSRRYERRVKYLYPRTVFVPDLDDGSPKIPPIDNPPDHVAVGSYSATPASTAYAEYDKYGALAETGPAFISGESARYVADNYEDPTLGAPSDFDPFNDLAYQGLPNVESVSSFPRWEGSKRRGTITAAGSFWIEDTSQLWEMADNSLKQHSGTATTGDTLTLTDGSKSADNFWLTVDRFVGMVLQVSFDAGATYEKRLITAYNSGTQTITVDVAFPGGTNGKPYKIDEPGYTVDRGAILNLWKGRKLTVTSGTSSRTVTILGNDKHRIFFTDHALEFTPTAGMSYEITQIEPGAVMQRTSVGVNNKGAVNGWLLTSDGLAVPDDRGQDWHTGTRGAYENCPTIVRHFGRFRRGDLPLTHFWNECYYAIDSMRWILSSFSWSSRSPANYLSSTPEANQKYYNLAFDSFTPDTSIPIADAGYDSATAAEADPFGSPLFGGDSGQPSANWDATSGGPYTIWRRYAYGVWTAATDKLNSQATLYVASDHDDEVFYNTSGGPAVATQYVILDEMGNGITSVSTGTETTTISPDLYEVIDHRRGLFHKYMDSTITNDLSRRADTPFPDANLSRPHDPSPTVKDGFDFTAAHQPSAVRNFYVINRVALVEKYDRSGGLTYVTPPTA